MDYNWNEISWIFESDGTLRDLYVKDVTIEDWKSFVDFLNENFNVRFGPVDERRRKIDKDFVVDYLTNQNEDSESQTISIILEDLLINCFLFSQTEIELDIEPSEIKSSFELDELIDFMKSISTHLKKPIILTGENQIEFPLVTIDSKNQMFKYLTESDARKLLEK
ncbi:MAG: hypothetical protein ABI426_07900 [Flavobacterium sp.]